MSYASPELRSQGQHFRPGLGSDQGEGARAAAECQALEAPAAPTSKVPGCRPTAIVSPRPTQLATRAIPARHQHHRQLTRYEDAAMALTVRSSNPEPLFFACVFFLIFLFYFIFFTRPSKLTSPAGRDSGGPSTSSTRPRSASPTTTRAPSSRAATSRPSAPAPTASSSAAAMATSTSSGPAGRSSAASAPTTPAPSRTCARSRGRACWLPLR